jgi:iron complex transport system ATP-binding protein
MLCGTGIRVRYGRRTVLENLTLELALGEVVVVIGPNGAGKSTLLRALAGEIRPDAGRVALDGRVLGLWRAAALAQRRAVLSQDIHLTFPFRVEEVVLLGRSPHAGFSDRATDEAIVEAALGETGGSRLAGRVYTTLSGGERQRVQMARVLAQIWPRPGEPAPYLLLDEPVASLDPAHQHATLKLARRWAARGAGVLAVLHDLNLAAMYADRIAILHRGALAADGAPGTVLTGRLIEDVFGMKMSVERRPERNYPVLLPI